MGSFANARNSDPFPERGKLMPETDYRDNTQDRDDWRTLFQVLPLNVYSRLMAQLGRAAQANGISPEAFIKDDKMSPRTGPRVAVWENLVILMERSENEAFKV
jgi:hypothetical protein